MGMPLSDVRDDVRELQNAVASLNDVVMEIVCGLAAGDDVSKGWAYQVVTSLSEHTTKLGRIPRIEPDDVRDWERES